MSRPVRAVLFDLDGTLAQTDHIVAAALAQAFTTAGLASEPPLAAFQALSGLPLEEIPLRLGLPAERAVTFQAAARGMVDRTRLFPGVLALLNASRAAGLRVGMITGKDRVRTLATLEHLRIDGLIEAVVTPDDPPAPKPSPEGVWWLYGRLGVAADETVLVGTQWPTGTPAPPPGCVRSRVCGERASHKHSPSACGWPAATVDELSQLLLARPAAFAHRLAPQSFAPAR